MGKDPEVSAGELEIHLHPQRLQPEAGHIVLGREALTRRGYAEGAPYGGIRAVGPDQVAPANRLGAHAGGPPIQIEAGDGRSRAYVGPGGAGPLKLVPAQLASRHGAHDGLLGVEHAAAPTERHLSHPLEADLIREAERSEEVDRLAGETAGTGLGPDVAVLFGHDDLTAGIGQNLGGAEARRSGADDQDFNRVHAGSARRRSAIAARSAAVGLRAIPVWRSTARPRLYRSDIT